LEKTFCLKLNNYENKLHGSIPRAFLFTSEQHSLSSRRTLMVENLDFEADGLTGARLSGFFMNRKPIIHVGIALIFLGIASLTYRGDSYAYLETMVGVSQPQTPPRADHAKTLPRSPLAGGLLLGGGIVLVAVGVKKSPWRH
jgi:hypothetical protein